MTINWPAFVADIRAAKQFVSDLRSKSEPADEK